VPELRNRGIRARERPSERKREREREKEKERKISYKHDFTTVVIVIISFLPLSFSFLKFSFSFSTRISATKAAGTWNDLGIIARAVITLLRKYLYRGVSSPSGRPVERAAGRYARGIKSRPAQTSGDVKRSARPAAAARRDAARRGASGATPDEIN